MKTRNKTCLQLTEGTNYGGIGQPEVRSLFGKCIIWYPHSPFHCYRTHMLEHEARPSAETTDSYEYPKTNPDPYATVRGKAQPVPQEMTDRFSKRMKIAVLRAALPLQSARSHVDSFIKRIQSSTPFQFHISGEKELADADIILANHQGPRIDKVQGSDSAETKAGLGGTEGLFAHALLPDGTRFVLKKFLVQRQEALGRMLEALFQGKWKASYQALADAVKASAFLKTDPITVDRTLEKPPRYVAVQSLTAEERNDRRQPWENYEDTMREERRRVAEEICRSVNEKKSPVIVYPEGTRSPDGRILGFVSEFFERILTDYILPRMKSNNGIRIGLLVADTLQTFPDGVGSGSMAYDQPITLRGMRYDPTNILAALQERGVEKPLSPKEIQYFGRMLLIDIHKKMSLALEGILTGSGSMELA